MAREHLKTRKDLSTTISKKLFERLDQYHKSTGIPKGRIVDKALEMLFSKVNNGEKIF